MTAQRGAPQPRIDAALPAPPRSERSERSERTARAETPREALAEFQREPLRAPRRRAARWPVALLVAILGAAALAAAIPIAMLAHGTRRAKDCIASIEAPRGQDMPDCRGEVRWLITPARVPWTANAARYRAEELNARAAIAAYVDASVGRPDAALLEGAGQGVTASEKVLAAGSRRTVLEELGRAAGAPDLGRSAQLLGDRRTLLSDPDRWHDWTIRLRTLEAALLEGGVARALPIARSYAAFDPHDTDLRTAVAAVLCLGGDAQRGVDLLTHVQNDRAEHRHEGWARNWGEVRVAILACAARGKIAPSAKPERGGAGWDDHEEARATQRLRLVGRAARASGAHTLDDDGDEAKALREAAFAAMEMLRNGTRSPGARVRLLAALLASGHPIDPSTASDLSTPRIDAGEAPLFVPFAAMATASDWIDEARRLDPKVAGAPMRAGAAKLRAMAARGDVTAAEKRALEAGAAAMALAAAHVLANEGDGDAAARAIDEAGEQALPGEPARALARSLAWRVAGDAERALAELDRAADASGRAAPIVGAASLLQRAELLAILGRRDEAAEIAIAADEAASKLPRGTASDDADDAVAIDLASPRGLDVHAQWTRLALAPPPRALRAPRSPDAAPPAGRAWPWIGVAGTRSSWMVAEAEGAARLAHALAFWSDARLASAEEKLALRYAAVGAHRGDAPRARTAYLHLASELLPRGAGDVEIWLDAFAITDARRVTLRAHSLARAEAARIRGDEKSAAAWTERFQRLVKIVSADEEGAELATALGI